MSFHPFSAVKAREGLRTGHTSQRDEKNYWLFSSVIWLFVTYHYGLAGVELGWFLLYDVTVALGILWIGLSEAYKANGGDQGQHFLRNIAVIGTPLGVVVLLASLLLYWMAWRVFPHVFNAQSFRDPEFAWTVINFMLFNGIEIWFWWRICHHLRELAQASTTDSSPKP
jgi:hypothetical protein